MSVVEAGKSVGAAVMDNTYSWDGKNIKMYDPGLTSGSWDCEGSNADKYVIVI